MSVIITRPEADAAPWVRQLSERGHEVRALPLIEISTAPDPVPLRQAWQHLKRYQAVMFVSGNAATQFAAVQGADAFSRWTDIAPRTRAWGTGPGTRQALLRAGLAAAQIDAPDAGQFDSEALWNVVKHRVRAGEPVLIVRGGDAQSTASVATPGAGRDWLANALGDAGVDVDFVVAYARAVPQWSPAQIALAQVAAQDGSLWLFSSAEAIGNLRQLLPQQDWGSARALTTHPRIARAAREAGFGVVRESRPGLQEVIASIESQT